MKEEEIWLAYNLCCLQQAGGIEDWGQRCKHFSFSVIGGGHTGSFHACVCVLYAAQGIDPFPSIPQDSYALYLLHVLTVIYVGLRRTLVTRSNFGSESGSLTRRHPFGELKFCLIPGTCSEVDSLKCAAPWLSWHRIAVKPSGRKHFSPGTVVSIQGNYITWLRCLDKRNKQGEGQKDGGEEGRILFSLI